MAVAAAAKRERLAQRRKTLGLTQEDLASLLRVERTTVARWERGEAAPLPLLRPRLARALRVHAGRLEELLNAGGALGPGTSRTTAAAVPRQLPAAVTDFTGRSADLEALTRILDDNSGRAPGTVVISAIGGTAGVGKTALALHWAHRAAGRFGDGQLYVNLRGFDPTGVPATPEEAIRGFLEALGVPPDKIPPLPDAQAGLYRGLVADRQMLIVLDNARDEQQIRPLLPASPGSLVLVTSRNQLTGLAAAYGARLITLDVLTHREAVRLLSSRIGHDRAAAAPEAITEIATLCACLPLALAVAAARAAARPRFALADLAAGLRDTAGRLDALDPGDPAACVRAVFSWSYQQLSPEAARMFRLLGVHPGPDITAAAAASLAALDKPGARRLLRELTRAHLIAEHVPGRYAFHDLLRAYATAQARDTDTDTVAATARLLDHYLHTASTASLFLQPTRDPITVAELTPGTVPEPLAHYSQAMTWFDAEHEVLSAAVMRAAGSGFDRHAWQLPWAMSDYLDRRGHWDERIAVFRTGLAAATRLGDKAGQAMSLRLLAYAYLRVGDYGQAGAHVRHSMELSRQVGDRRGETKARTVLAAIASCQGRHADAIGHCDQALQLFRAVGNTAGEVEMLNNIGWYHALLGDYQQSRAFCEKSLTLSAELGHRHTEASAWDSLGFSEHQDGKYGRAVACYQRALSLFRELGDRNYEANTLSHLGDSRHATGDLPRAREAWRQALAILDDLEHPDADKIRAKLTAIKVQDPHRDERAAR
ncbi:MAG TPA: tetratricopeptide repeat protein [Trebonia sp.]|jgi:tetratricopeptide (TPR) repeat protein/transcriptional regulator with XRE-family HTH domain